MAWVQSGRWLDSGIMALFLMLVSATVLHMFGHLWNIAQRKDFAQYKVGAVLKMLFHFNKDFDFNLTHILLMCIVISLLSLRPDYELEATLNKKGDKKKGEKKQGAAEKPEVTAAGSSSSK